MAREYPKWALFLWDPREQMYVLAAFATDHIRVSVGWEEIRFDMDDC